MTWIDSVQFSLVSCARLSGTPWRASRQISLSITSSRSLLKLMFIALVMPSNHLIFCRPLSSHLQSFSASGSSKMSQFFALGGQNIALSIQHQSFQWVFSTDFLEDWLVFFLPEVQGTLKSVLQHHSSVLSFLYSPTPTYIHDYWKNHSFV